MGRGGGETTARRQPRRAAAADRRRHWCGCHKSACRTSGVSGAVEEVQELHLECAHLRTRPGSAARHRPPLLPLRHQQVLGRLHAEPALDREPFAVGRRDDPRSSRPSRQQLVQPGHRPPRPARPRPRRRPAGGAPTWSARRLHGRNSPPPLARQPARGVRPAEGINRAHLYQPSDQVHEVREQVARHALCATSVFTKSSALWLPRKTKWDGSRVLMHGV